MGLFSWIEDTWDDLCDFVSDIIESVKQFVKSIVIHLLSFVKHIVSWFKDPKRLANLRKNKNVIATAVKEHLSNGNYNVVNCLFDKEAGEVIDISDSKLYDAEELDSQTEYNFGDKPMMVLQ